MVFLTNLLWLPLLPVPCLANHEQQPLSSSSRPSTDETHGYEFKWPIKRVAIIGAGVSGLIAYREFVNAGFDHVRVFERDHVPGGNWHYTEQTPLDAPIPNVDPAIGDFEPSLPPHGKSLPVEEQYWDAQESDVAERWREHKGPKPVWESLESNAPAPIQQITEIPWSAGTTWHLPHRKLSRYLRSFASLHGANSNDQNTNVSYNTRVELVERRHDSVGRAHGWTLTLKRFEQTGPRSSKATWWTEDFDAIVVATGRYNAPNIPPIPGLQEWDRKFPGTVTHSRQYRRPQPFSDETILVVGAATSGVEIAREINPHARKIYQSVRPANFSKIPYQFGRLLLQRLPANVSVVPEIRYFHASNGSVELANGTFLSDISRVIFATGFRYSFPFLPQFHDSSGFTANARPIVTDGTHLRSLYKDFIYIEEPTIGFLSMNWGMQSFTYSEYLSLALAKVWSRTAILPASAELWRENEQRVKDRGGYGKHFQFLGADRTSENIRFFVGWLNDAAVRFGGRQIDGESKDVQQISSIWMKAQYSQANTELELEPDRLIAGSRREERSNILDSIYGEDW
ncbi:FAD/NAD(P)-binding domain-containing protein [Mycena rebaudengoi]|nr:FAD/NAD(P)-binding domain-containing protein [Mycena rebaudengoi]